MRIALAGAAALAAAIGLLVLVTSVSSRGSFAVSGTFILWDEFPTAATGEPCHAKRSVYYDINEDTGVRAETPGGALLAETTLGSGRIAAAAELTEIVDAEEDGLDLGAVTRLLEDSGLQACVFRFSFRIDSETDGRDGYVVVLGNRGRWEFSEAQLREPGALQLSLGLR